MCGLEVPDFEATIAVRYADDPVQAWLVNTTDDLDTCYGFLEENTVSLPNLLAVGEGLYDLYAIEDTGEFYAPYPVHVVIDQEGVIRHVSRDGDLQAVMDTVDGLLGR